MRGFSAEGFPINPDFRRSRLCQPLYLDLKIGKMRVFDNPPRDMSIALVSVKQGTLDIWLGDRGIEGVPKVPQFHFLQGQGVQWFPVPPSDYVITVASTGTADLIACITLVGE